MKNKFYLILILVLALALRLYQLGEVPISLHGDEVGVGYNAYALLRRGIDEYGKSWPLVFRADVTPMIFYATMPAIWLFGMTEFAIRFPSAIIGTISILVFYFFVRELISFYSHHQQLTMNGQQFKNSTTIALLSTLLLSLTPWHIQISRIAHDALYGLTIQLAAVAIFFYSLRKQKPAAYFISSLLLGLSFYAYHGPRLTSPLLLLGLILLNYKRIKQMLNLTKLIAGYLLMIIVALPIVFIFLNTPLAQTRFGGINIFIGSFESLHTFITLPFKFIVNLLNQFNPLMLFLDTCSIRYFNVQNSGLILLIFLPFLIIAAFYILKYKQISRFIFFWIIIAVLPGALTLGPPNAGRIFMLLPILILITGIGLYSIFPLLIKHLQTKISANIPSLQLFKQLNKATVLIFMIIVLFGVNTGFFLHRYFNHSPKQFSNQWQYGMKQLAQIALNYEGLVDRIIISEQFEQAYIYVLFYGQKDPHWLLNHDNLTRHHFIGYHRFGKYEFREINWSTDKNLDNSLIIGTPMEIPIDKNISVINNSKDQKIAVVAITN